ncbi:MAG: alcohol dehydrogenase catalytic domain-containing protein [Candidatus Methylomirabilia bacterium]
MNAAIYRGAGVVEWGAWPEPTVGPGELVLKLRGCGLCGSDITKIQQGRVRPPAVFGHEAVGEVAAVGEGVTAFAVGNRLVVGHHVPCSTCHFCRRGSPSMCRAFKSVNLDPGGFAEYCRVPAPNVRHAAFRVPEECPDEVASFTEPLACCLRAVKRARLLPGDSALVVGLGSIGCLLVQLLTRSGVRALAAEPISERQRLARRFGAEAYGEPDRLAEAVREATEGRGVDVALITAGGAAVLTSLSALVRDGGAFHYFAGGANEPLPIPLDSLYHRELTVTATYSAAPAEFGEAFELLVHGHVQVEPLVSHRLPLRELAEGVRLTVSRQAIKVFLTGGAP